MKHVSAILTSLAIVAASAILPAKADLHEIVYAYQNRGWFIHDIQTSYLHEKGVLSSQVYLNQGDRMVLRGEGADAVRDIDLTVYRPDGSLLKRDNDRDPHPCVMFTAPTSGYYTVRLTLFELWPGSDMAEVALVLAEQ